MNEEKQIEEMALDLNHIIHFKDNGLVARYATAEAMYELGYRKQNKWISVEDRLPDEDIPVLVYKDKYNDAYANMETAYWCDGRWMGVASEYVTHWMILPSPPIGKENNNETN